MGRLTFYLFRVFSRDAIALFLVATFLVWITQALRLFDLVTAKGQDMLTLMGQAALTAPPLARAIIYICMGIGLARGLKALQDSRELHSIHAAARTKALWSASLLFALTGALAVTLLAHWLEPVSKRVYANWSAQITAELVGKTLTPHRFSEISPGFVMVIGDRQPDGTILDFFADDRRDPDAQRTYTAKSAIITVDDDGYYLNLIDGSLQYLRAGSEFSEIEFSGYELSLDRLAADVSVATSIKDIDTTDLLRDFADGINQGAIVHEMDRRFAEALYVLAVVCFVLVMASLPHARRGRQWLPLEVLVLIVALGVRVGGEMTRTMPNGYATSPLIVIAICLFVLMLRINWHRIGGIRAQEAPVVPT